jgi:multimeric flavodoxin WrbA
VLVVTDAKLKDGNVQQMVSRFCAPFASNIEIGDLHDLKIVLSCIGCLQCGDNNECILSERDDFVDFYRDKMLKSDVLIFAGRMTDRYLSPLWKNYSDRSFFMEHRPSLLNKQLGFIISDPLSQNGNLREILEGYTGWQPANIVGVVTGEMDESREIDIQLQ